MVSLKTRLNSRASLAVCVLAGCALFGVRSYATDKPPVKTPPKTATPAKAATTAKPASTAGGVSHGATAAHTGPTTGNPSGHTMTTTGGHGATTGVGGHGTTMAGGHPGGLSNDHRTATGRIAPAGSHTIATRNGAVTRRPDGRISDVHDARRGMDVHHGLDGGRRVSVERADHSRIVAERGRRGYIERRYSWHGHDYGRRSYYWHGHEYNRYYRGYYYHGAFVNVYAPGFYYRPAFYGWAYNPWYAPVPYAWGWAANPWYGYYGFYFAPYPVYAGPAFWLTDYLISNELAAAYAAQQEANLQAAAAANAAAAGGQPILTPDIKAQIADEVKAQIALENAEAQQNTQGQDADPASSGIARILSDGHSHVFVAGDALDVVDANGAECALSDGDVLQFSGPAPADNQTDVNLLVLSSKGGKECPRSATVTVAVTDLQEMQNHLRETIDQGLQELQSKQGQGGLPAAPPSATAPPVQTAFAQNAPPPEANGAADVNQQLTEADKADQEAAQSAPIGGMDGGTPAQAAATPAPAPAATVNIALGQTIEEVTAALGPPVTVIDLGSKKIYKYKDMKITFKAGKVSDVE
jgi:hypothetical protein